MYEGERVQDQMLQQRLIRSRLEGWRGVQREVERRVGGGGGGGGAGGGGEKRKGGESEIKRKRGSEKWGSVKERGASSLWDH